MKNLLPSLFVVLFISNVVGQDSSKPKQSFDLQEYIKSESERIVGLKFPAFKIKTSASSIFSNKDLPNKVVFINFWFANCTPFIAEMAGLNKMFDKLKDNKDFIFVSFTYDSDSLT